MMTVSDPSNEKNNPETIAKKGNTNNNMVHEQEIRKVVVLRKNK